jgi:hypothetical protein
MFATLALLVFSALDTVPVRAKEPAPEKLRLHQTWDTVMKTHNHGGRVDYAALKANPDGLNSYIEALGSISEAAEMSWPKAQRIAFWINAYNAFTIKAVVENYPIRRSLGFAGLRFPASSIRQIPGVWDKQKWSTAGRTVTLSEMEHEILRKELREPRIHFAIVCASVGCPPLRAEAYEGDRLESQLEDNARQFVLSHRVKIDTTADKIGINPIIKWFSRDFERFDDGSWDRYPKNMRGPMAFISRYLPNRKALLLRRRAFDIEWLPYDWSLNDSPKK